MRWTLYFMLVVGMTLVVFFTSMQLRASIQLAGAMSEQELRVQMEQQELSYLVSTIVATNRSDPDKNDNNNNNSTHRTVAPISNANAEIEESLDNSRIEPKDEEEIIDSNESNEAVPQPDLAASSISSSSSSPPSLLSDSEPVEPELPIPEIKKDFPVIDILSTGSQKLAQLQDAQRQTVGSHRAVRYFYGASEADDTEPNCDKRLKPSRAHRVSYTCRRRNYDQYPVLAKLAQRFILGPKLMRKSNPSGWLCAQKRPIDSFMNMVQKYNYTTNANGINTTSNLPDYLLVMDDDSWLNLDNVLQVLPVQYPSSEPRIIAGCMIVMDDMIDFTLPHGGFGMLFTKAALERFLQPITCETLPESLSDEKKQNDTASSNTTLQPPPISGNTTEHHQQQQVPTDFESMACWRLQQNGIGERRVFRNGMSIAQLMHAYATHQPFNDVFEWDSVGYCLHSDTAWAYFLNYYHIAARPSHGGHFSSQKITASGAAHDEGYLLSDRLVGYNHSQMKFWGKNKGNPDLWRQCRNGNDFDPQIPTGNGNCGVDAHFCHRITAPHMKKLHGWNQQRHAHNYRTVDANSSFTTATR